MASVAKESISSAVTLTSEDVLKRIVEQAGGALKTVRIEVFGCIGVFDLHPVCIRVYDYLSCVVFFDLQHKQITLNIKTKARKISLLDVHLNRSKHDLN